MQKIMFNDRFGLTEAVLKGTKTMTRRMVPQSVLNAVEKYQGDYYSGALESISTKDAILNMCTGEKMFKCIYNIGEVVAVAQSYKDAGIDPHFLMFQPIEDSIYRAEMEIEAMFTGGWNNKMFVRADLMPNQIRITDIKIERLQDISDEDCMKEGISKGFEGGFSYEYHDEHGFGYNIFSHARDAFISLIDNVSVKGTWERNPFVFVYTFKLIK